jgi:hypothetical protein
VVMYRVAGRRKKEDDFLSLPPTRLAQKLVVPPGRVGVICVKGVCVVCGECLG